MARKALSVSRTAREVQFIAYMTMNGSNTPERVSTDTSANGVYSGLRHLALSTKRTEIGIEATSGEDPAWGVLMETGYDGATVSLFALADGTTSLYFSNGGGVIGGQAHEAVRLANAAFLKEANQFLKELKSSSSFPIPETSHTVFYVLTDSGILSDTALEADLGYNRHHLSPFFHAGHEVITQLRLISESQENDA